MPDVVTDSKGKDTGLANIWGLSRTFESVRSEREKPEATTFGEVLDETIIH